jgi:hypothetical protein
VSIVSRYKRSQRKKSEIEDGYFCGWLRDKHGSHWIRLVTLKGERATTKRVLEIVAQCRHRGETTICPRGVDPNKPEKKPEKEVQAWTD